MPSRQSIAAALRSRHLRAALCGCSFALASAGCYLPVDDAGPVPDELAEGEVAQAEQALWLQSTNFWPGGIVPICFGAERWTRNEEGVLWPEPMPTGSAAWIEQSTHIRQLLEEQYEAVPGAFIDFQGWGACEEAEVGTFTGGLRITLRDDGGFNWAFRHCAPGDHYGDRDMNGKPGPCFSRSGYTSQYEAHIATSRYGYAWGTSYDGAVLHEVGHALGFPHEYLRSDAEKCGDRAQGTSEGRFLTAYDAGSVMNDTYCYGTGQLTPLDRLGVQIVYASRFTNHPLSGHASLVLGDGQLLLRSDDAVATDWSARGALAGAYENGVVNWFRNGSSQGASLEYAATRLPAGSSDMRATFRDFRGRQHSTATQRVRVDDHLHTAILMAAL